MGELEARAKGKMAQAEIETINQLKAKQQELEKKGQDLKAAGDSKIEQVEAQIEPELRLVKDLVGTTRHEIQESELNRLTGRGEWQRTRLSSFPSNTVQFRTNGRAPRN